MSQLNFEKPILELEAKIKELQNVSGDVGFSIRDEISRMEGKIERLMVQTYEKLTPDQKVQVARHGDRPHFLHYVSELVEDFTPLAGDRNFGEDHALIGGLGRFRGQSCVIMGHERGHDTQTRLHHNFGMARPEGYRKAIRLMQMAEQFQLPVISLVDTAGAYPGVGAEERGQSEAIARSIEACLDLTVPNISVIIGEGGSGGAIAIAATNRVYMLQHAIYSVISPEGCASILWRSATHAKEAANALKITARDLLELGVIDGMIEEPLGGAHRNANETIQRVGDQLETTLTELKELSPEEIKSQREEKFLAIGR